MFILIRFYIKFVIKYYQLAGGKAMSAKRSNGNDVEIKQLHKEIDLLKRQLAEARTYNKRKSTHRWRGFFKWLSIGLAGVLFIVASTVLYIAMTLINTDRFMNVAGPLAQQPAVQSAVAQKTTDALFSQVDVEQLAAQALPPRAEFLAPTLTSQLKNTTQQQAQKIIASDEFQQVWQNSLRTAHQKLIQHLKDYQGDGSINLNDVYSQLSQRLEGGKLSFLANKSLPPKIGDVTVVQANWLPTAHRIVANINLLRALAIFLLLILLGAAIWLSERRRKTIIQIDAIISGLSVAMLVSLRLVRNAAVDNVQPQYQQAATEAWKVFIKPFAVELVIFIILGLTAVFIAWVSGASASAEGFRRRMDRLFAGKLHESMFKKENGFTLWAGRNRKVLFSLVAAIFVLSLLFISLTLKSFILLLVISIILALAVESLSAKPTAS